MNVCHDCGEPVPTSELIDYDGRCEDCWATKMGHLFADKKTDGPPGKYDKRREVTRPPGSTGRNSQGQGS